jgi:GxxExxY protein
MNQERKTAENLGPETTVYPEQELTQRILEAAFAVHNALGAGFLEKVYENALLIELRQMGIAVSPQAQLKVKYKGAVVGDYQADLLVEGRVIIELKASSVLEPNHEAQLMNYLRASGLKVGFLLNFGRPRLQYKRFVC